LPTDRPLLLKYDGTFLSGTLCSIIRTTFGGGSFETTSRLCDPFWQKWIGEKGGLG